MAITTGVYGKSALLNLLNGSNVYDLDTDTYKVSLHTSTYTPDADAHDFYNDLTNELTTANGYTAGGATLSGLALSQETTGNYIAWDATDTSWTATESGITTVRIAVIRKDTGSSATSPLIMWVDFGANTGAVAGGKFIIEWAAAGLLKWTY